MNLSKKDIPTPALLVDLDLFEANLSRLAEAARASGKKLRPHAKAHKCVEISRRQVAAGATGICVATVREAEMMAHAGIEGILLTSPLAEPAKMARVVAAGAMAVVDNIQQVRWYQEAAFCANAQLSLLVDLDVGDHRTGAANTEQALEIALEIDQSSHLWLRGVQAYSVSGSHGKDVGERLRLSTHTYGIASEALAAMASHGLHTDILSGGSTGTWDVDLGISAVTELQAGSYPLMDLAYGRLGIDFHAAMTVLATVISANHSGFVTVDAGFKAFSTDRPFGPQPVGLPDADYRWGGDEFGFLDLGQSVRKPRLGDKLEFLPPHCDPTANLYDRIYACRAEEVEEIWPVMERWKP